MKKTLTAVVIGLALVAGACGGDDGGDAASTDDPLVQALATQASQDSDPGSPLTNQEDAECWAARVVGGIGEERLAELGITETTVGDVGDYSWTSEEIDTIVDSLDSCIDLEQAIAQTLVEDFGEEGANCVAGELDGGLLKELMAAGLTDSDPPEDFITTFLEIAQTCDIPLSG